MSSPYDASFFNLFRRYGTQSLKEVVQFTNSIHAFRKLQVIFITLRSYLLFLCRYRKLYFLKLPFFHASFRFSKGTSSYIYSIDNADIDQVSNCACSQLIKKFEVIFLGNFTIFYKNHIPTPTSFIIGVI